MTDNQEPTSHEGGYPRDHHGPGSAWEAYQLDLAEAAASSSGEETSEGDDVDVPALPAMDVTNDEEGNESKSSSFQAKWETHIDNLKAFKEEYGHVNVSRSDDKELGRFVNNQRQNFRKLLEGDESSLTKGRIQDLDKVSDQIFVICFGVGVRIFFASLSYIVRTDIHDPFYSSLAFNGQ